MLGVNTFGTGVFYGLILHTIPRTIPSFSNTFGTGVFYGLILHTIPRTIPSFTVCPSCRTKQDNTPGKSSNRSPNIFDISVKSGKKLDQPSLS